MKLYKWSQKSFKNNIKYCCIKVLKYLLEILSKFNFNSHTLTSEVYIL